MRNDVSLDGRMANDLRIENDGNMGLFTIAVQRDYKNKKTGNYDADFFDVICFNQSVQFMQNNFYKGKPINIDGTLQSYKTKDGNYKVQVKLDRAYFPQLNSTQDNQPSHKDNDSQSKNDYDKKNDPFKGSQNDVNVSDDDLPF